MLRTCLQRGVLFSHYIPKEGNFFHFPQGGVFEEDFPQGSNYINNIPPEGVIYFKNISPKGGIIFRIYPPKKGIVLRLFPPRKKLLKKTFSPRGGWFLEYTS